MVSGLQPSDNQRCSNCLAYASMQSVVCNSLQSISSVHSQHCGKAAGTLRVVRLSHLKRQIGEMADYTYAKKAELYVFQSLWDAVCAKNTFCIISYRLRKLVHLKGNKVIVGNQKVSTFQ